MKKRVVRYDFMRVLMSLFVICVHTGFPSFISSNNLLNNSIRSFLVVCNGVFFMISGKFNLRKILRVNQITIIITQINLSV